ncbi:MAG TPA: flavin reductase family protein [Ilumatobacteraceae bacterium]|jgi:flavin reductase (DIM6/NTAB) family NADH-FMN oxidoreductase RutF|nr:flavin reductase family protein [Ilumatobacteraceae bacterium]
MEIDPLKYRLVLGHFPTGVTVVTAMVDGEPVGFTIGSFTSVSLEPPLVGFLPMTTSERWIKMASTGSFCVNVLGIDHGDLCWRFAKSSIEEPFEGVSWAPSPITGSPIIDGAIAWMDCTTAEVVDAGDHYFVMGLVVAMDHADEESKPAPLLFFRGQLGGFAGQT